MSGAPPAGRVPDPRRARTGDLRACLSGIVFHALLAGVFLLGVAWLSRGDPAGYGAGIITIGAAAVLTTSFVASSAIVVVRAI